MARSLALFLIAFLVSSSAAQAQVAKETVRCPFVVDLQTKKFTKAKTKYKCYLTAKGAQAAGYQKLDSSTIPTPTPGPSPQPTADIPAGYTRVTFTSSGGTLTFPITVSDQTVLFRLRYAGTGGIAVLAKQKGTNRQLGSAVFSESGPVDTSAAIEFNRNDVGEMFFQVIVTSADKPWTLDVDYK